MSVEFDEWDPQKEDFQDKEFNSYDHGPGKYLGSNNYKTKNAVRLHVSNIPPHINEDGLRALFLKTGTVTDIWKHRVSDFAFVTMASLKDAEFAIRKLNDFKIDKYKIAVKVAKKHKGNAGLMQQKKGEEEIFNKLDSGNSFCQDEDWNNSDYPTFSALDLKPMNSYQNRERKSSFSSIKSNGSKKHMKPCKKCGKSGNKRCSQCKTPYCSVNCQQLDWFDNHHEECINIYLQNTTLEELAEKFDIDLNAETLSGSYSDKPLYEKTLAVDSDHTSSSSVKEAQSKKNPSKNAKMEKMPSTKGHNPKPASQRKTKLTQDKDFQKTFYDVHKRFLPLTQVPIKNQKSPSCKIVNEDEITASESAIQKKPDESNVANKAMKTSSKVQLPHHNSCQVLVTNVASYKDIHVQLIEEANFKMTTYLITELAKVYGDNGKKIPCISYPEVGEIYACCYSADNLWYRAQIVSINGADITVKYVDYGNTEITSCDMMRDLVPKLKDIPQQLSNQFLDINKKLIKEDAIVFLNPSTFDLFLDHLQVTKAVWCALDISPSKTSDIDLLIKQEFKYDQPYRLMVIQTGEPYLVTLYDDKDVDVGKKLTNLIGSKKSQGHSSDDYTNGDDVQQITSDAIMVADIKNKADHLKPDNNYNILPFNVISPDDFMVQVVTLDKDFSQFSLKLQSCAHSCLPVSQKVVPGQLVLVQKPQGQWCRAEVMQIEDESLTVRLLDYGSIETVLIHTVHSAPPFCLDHPVITVHSKLAEIKPADKGWSPKLCNIFQETLEAMNASVRVQGQHIIGEYIGLDINQKCLWKLIDLCTNASIADLLVLDGHAVVMNPELPSHEEQSLKDSKVSISDIPKIALTVGSIQNGIAIDFHSETFFINLIQSDQKEFQITFNDVLDKVGNKGTDYVACENEIVAAKFSVDHKWYRGQILQVHGDSMFTVFFIDYGNCERLSSSQLHPLPKRFLHYPKQAIHCRLHNACIPKDGLLQFAKLVLNNICTYKIVSQNNDIFNVVVYDSNGECLNDMFKEEIASGYVSETESLKSNSQAGNSPHGFSSESVQSSQTSSLSSESSTALSPAVQTVPFQSTSIPAEGSASETCQHVTRLNERKLSTLSLESQADSDFVSCVNSPKVKYYTKNMNCLMLDTNSCYKLHCTSVVDADGFYCQLLDDTAILQYIELMRELVKLCNESSEEPTSLPEKGQLVAAKYLDDWYRAKVTDTHKDKVEVFFIDYGNVSVVDKAQLREISSEIFVEFPILAVRCCLIGISKQKWSNEISKFQDQTMNVKVIQKVGNTYQIIFEEDLEDQLENKDVPSPSSPPPPPRKSAEDAEKEKILRQIEELQKKLATLN